MVEMKHFNLQSNIRSNMLLFTVQNDVCAEFDTFHTRSSAEGGKFLSAHLKSQLMTCAHEQESVADVLSKRRVDNHERSVVNLWLSVQTAGPRLHCETSLQTAALELCQSAAKV